MQLSLTDFQALNYIASHGDLISAFGIDIEAAKSHYAIHGKSEGRTLDNFDEWGYLASNNDLMNAFGSDTTEAIKHYISFGKSEGRLTNLFNAESYLNNYSDLRNTFGYNQELATRHYVASGFNEGRTSSSRASFFTHLWGRFWGDNGFFDLSDTALSLFQGLSIADNYINGGDLFELNSNKNNAIGIFNLGTYSGHSNYYHIKFTYNSSSNLYDAELIDSGNSSYENISNYSNLIYYLDSKVNLRAYTNSSSNSLYSYYDFSRNEEVVDIDLTNNLTTLGLNDKYLYQIYDTKYFGQLVKVGGDNGIKFISNVQDPDGNCQIILSVDNNTFNRIYFDREISENNSGYLYTLSEETSYDSNSKFPLNHLLYKIDSTTNTVETLSINDEDAFVIDNYYSYFLWTDNDGIHGLFRKYMSIYLILKSIKPGK